MLKYLLEDLPQERKEAKKLFMGTKDSGIVLYLSKEGIEINGYYKIDENGPAYGVIRKALNIDWIELDKLKKEIFATKKKKETNEGREEPVTQDYLESLTIVTLNDNKYYIDIQKAEIRPIDRPHMVYNLKVG